MCRKNEADCIFIKPVTLFLPQDSVLQNLQICPRRSIEAQHEICRFEVWSLKDTQNLLRMFNFRQIFSGYHQSYIFYDSVNFCKSLDWKY